MQSIEATLGQNEQLQVMSERGKMYHPKITPLVLNVGSEAAYHEPAPEPAQVGPRASQVRNEQLRERRHCFNISCLIFIFIITCKFQQI